MSTQFPAGDNQQQQYRDYGGEPPPGYGSTLPRRPKTGLIIAVAAALAMAGVAGCSSAQDPGPAPTTDAAPASAEDQGAAATTEAAPAPAQQDPPSIGDGSSPTSPLAPGSTVSINSPLGPAWAIRIVDTNWDYSEEDVVYTVDDALVAFTVEFTNTSTDPQTPQISTGWTFLDFNGTELPEWRDVADEDIVKVEQLRPGESASGDICFQIPSGLSQGILGFRTHDLDAEFTYVVVE